MSKTAIYDKVIKIIIELCFTLQKLCSCCDYLVVIPELQMSEYVGRS